MFFGRKKLVIFVTFTSTFVSFAVVSRYLSTNEEYVDVAFQKKAWKILAQENLVSSTTESEKHLYRGEEVTKEDHSGELSSTEKKFTPSRYDDSPEMNTETVPTRRPAVISSNEISAQVTLRRGSSGVSRALRSRYIPEHRIFHLDLKGAPPKLSYLKSVIPLIRDAGATGILIEYEDMFPFWGSLRNASAKNAYSARDVQQIQSWAAENDLIVIPLVQTFGHLEFILKLDEFKHLREVPIYPQSICPSKEDSWKLIIQVIDQVASLHPDSEWIHIGCDEVYQLGQCSQCSEKIYNLNKDPESKDYYDTKSLFLDHVHRVANYVRQEKKLIPIMWDDMLRTIPSQTIKNSGIGDIVEPMVWVYIEEIDRFVDSMIWASYSEVFPFMWTASAFKGAFGEQLFSVNIQRHVANQLSWLEVMKRESRGSHRIKFRGIVLTGWSRYDHFAVLCELLPAAIPSLILSLSVLTRGGHDFESVKSAHRILQCGTQKAFLTSDELRRNPTQWDIQRCRYPGSSLLGLLSTYNMNKKEVETALDRVNNLDGWMTHYSVTHKYSSPYRVHEVMKGIVYLPGSLRSLEDQMKSTLLHYFDPYTVEEWLEQHLDPLKKTLEDITLRATALTSNISWPRRPLATVDDLRARNLEKYLDDFKSNSPEKTSKELPEEPQLP